MKEYIKKLQELLKQINKKHLIAAAAAVVIFILGFISGCSCGGQQRAPRVQRHHHRAYGSALQGARDITDIGGS